MSPESRHSNGSAVGMSGNSMQTITYAPRHMPFLVTTGGAAAATGAPLVAGGQPTAWVPTSGGGFIIQSPNPNPMEVFPMSSPGTSFTMLSLQGCVMCNVCIKFYHSNQCFGSPWIIYISASWIRICFLKRRATISVGDPDNFAPDRSGSCLNLN